tara:strand:+ start:10827 stop:11651 length:825 start_codon:yes stop_codon:yes gene_type:complete
MAPLKSENKNKVDVTHLEKVPKTLLLTLKAKFEASIDPSLSYSDSYIETIYRLINDPIKKTHLFFLLKKGIILRTKGIDYLLKKEILEREEGSTVINLACGLDTRFERMREKFQFQKWFDCDLPQVIEVRKLFFEESLENKMTAFDILDESWPLNFKGVNDPIIIIEGLTMYLDEEKIKKFFSILNKYFSHYSLILDFMSPFLIKKEWMMPVMEQFDVNFTWGASSPEEFCKYEPRLKIKDSLGFMDGFRHQVFKTPLFNILRKKKNLVLLRKG